MLNVFENETKVLNLLALENVYMFVMKSKWFVQLVNDSYLALSAMAG
jgi:hypothetical protein